MPGKVPAQTCLSCHFLSKVHYDFSNAGQSTLTWEAAERAAGEVADYYATECHKGVWNPHVGEGSDRPLDELLRSDRRECVFYFEHSPGMLYDTASEIAQQRHAAREQKRAHLHARIGWALTVLGTLAVMATTIIVALVTK